MNKRKAKKRYKQIYEEELKKGVICIDLNSRCVRTVRFKCGWQMAEFGIVFDRFSVEPMSPNLAPEITIVGERRWARVRG